MVLFFLPLYLNILYLFFYSFFLFLYYFILFTFVARVKILICIARVKILLEFFFLCFRALAAVKLNSYIAILASPIHKNPRYSSGAIGKKFYLLATVHNYALQLKVKIYIYIYSPSLYLFFYFFYFSSVISLSPFSLNTQHSTLSQLSPAQPSLAHPLKVVGGLTCRYWCRRRISVSSPLPCSPPSKPSSNSSYLIFFFFEKSISLVPLLL